MIDKPKRLSDFTEYDDGMEILKALFWYTFVDAQHKTDANYFSMFLGDYSPRWLQMIANANLDHPEAAADEAAREFCVEWLEAQGFKVTLEAQPEPPKYEKNSINKAEVMMGITDIWVTFDRAWQRNTYRNPSTPSLHRFYRTASKKDYRVRLEHDDRNPIIIVEADNDHDSD